MRNARLKVAWLGVLVVLVAAMGCGESPDSDTEKEIEYFKTKLSNGASMVDACMELDALCTATGFGCKAFNLFCTIPSKQEICKKLAATCTNYPVACDVYMQHCTGNGPQTDAGPPPSPLDSGPPPSKKDAGWLPPDPDAGWWEPYPDAAPPYPYPTYPDAGWWWPDV
jgi:hypothetical protein